MRSPEEIAKEIITRANDAYRDRNDYPAFKIAPWDDRIAWSAYIEKIAAEVLAEEMKPDERDICRVPAP